MIRYIAKSMLNKFGAASFAVLFPLALAGCGSTSGGNTLANSAVIAPDSATKSGRTVLSNKQGLTSVSKKTTIAAAAKAPVPVKTAVLAKSTAISKVKTAVKTAAKIPAKTTVKAAPVVMAKVKNPPTPMRKPYVKVRSAKVLPKTIKKTVSPVKQIAKTAPPKAELAKRTASKKTPVTTASIKKPVVKQPPIEKVIAKPVKAKMVPAKVIPVQVVEDDVPQDIADAFNNTPRSAPRAPAPVVEKVVAAKSTPVPASFGQANHSFTGQ